MASLAPAVFKRGKVYYYRFQLDGCRVERSTREVSRDAAERVAEEAFRVAQLRARGEEPEPVLSELVEMWAKARAGSLEPRTIEGVCRFVRLHMKGIHSLPISQLTTQRVEEARAEYLASGHAKSSANQWMKDLRLLVKWAISCRMLRTMPWSVKPLKAQQKPKPVLPDHLASSWLAKVEELSQGEPAVGQAVRIMLGLGLRVSEASGARWEWLDLQRGTYTPGQTKGREAWPRPVPGWLLEDLRPRAKTFGFICLTREDGPVHPERIRRWMRAACQALGMQRLTPHRLRSTYATLLMESGVPIQDVQQVLGHKDSRTTLGYCKVNMERVVRAQITIADRMGMAGRKSGAPTHEEPRQEPEEVLPGVMRHEDEGE